MRICTTVVLSLALAVTGACKKKGSESKPTTDTGSGSAAMTGSGTTGSAGGMAGTGSAPAPKPMTGDELAKAYLKCSELVNAGKTDDFLATCIADGFKSEGMMQITSKDQLKKEFDNMKAMAPDAKMAPQVVLVNGHNIAAVILSTGTNTGPMKMPDGSEIPKTDKKFGALWFQRIKLNDEGKATEEWAMMDSGTMMAQLGQKMPKGMEGRPLMDKGMDGAPVVIVAADDAKEKANLEAAKKTTEAFNAHKVADMAAAYTDDAVESDQAGTADSVGKKEIQKGAEEFLAVFPDGKVEEKEIWAAGDYVVMIGKFTGTSKKPAATVEMDFAEIMQFKDGKIAKLWRFRDNPSMMQQMMGGAADPSAKPTEGKGGAIK